tara:strand:- start:359 stop:508 length:150 start_codon:yes stop_codon:yes gene_type:complete
MKKGDLAKTIIKGDVVILLEPIAKKVWNVLRLDGSISSEWVLNLEPFSK